MIREFVTLLALFAIVPGTLSAQEDPFARWEGAIKKYEEEDAKNAPPRGAVLFVGSSSIRLWGDLADAFPDHRVINRGFGGSTIADSTHFAERIVIKHRPRIVVLYAGDNDLARKKTPEQVASDFAAFVARIHKDLPDTRVLFISIKPSTARLALFDQIKKANGLIEEMCKMDKRLEFVDVFTPMLDKEGKPNPELLKKDGLHPNEKAYALWAEKVRPLLGEGRRQ
jgi:lysophospholipase L1-like esterase